MRTRTYALAGAVVAVLAATPAGRDATAATFHRITGQPICSTCHNTRSVVADARRYLGIPYVWGGECTGPKHCAGLDCSGLTEAVYRDEGVSLPRTSAAQAHAGTPVRDSGTPARATCCSGRLRPASCTTSRSTPVTAG